MPMTQDTLGNLLARENEEYWRLLERHQSYEKKLEKLNARHHLNDEEKVEAITLKKHKLALKDRMAEILRQHGRSA
ncbi:MAG TPA: YdcH family protein, partial [Candidatus Polarisedimenticolia bacterium]|nr:YdcH family protein [Candidatus Polarisedimenticolia bacterium]